MLEPHPPSRIDRLTGPFVTATALIALHTLGGSDSLPEPVYLACVAYAAFRGGLVSGFISTMMVTGDGVIRTIAASLDAGPTLSRLEVLTLASLIVLFLTGHLKERADRASGLSRTNQELTGLLIERARTEEGARALAAMSRALVEPLDFSSVHQRIVSTVLDLFRVRQAMLYWFDPASHELVCVAAAGELDDADWVGRRVPAGRSTAGEAVMPRRAIWSREAPAQDVDGPDTLLAQAQLDGSGSVLTVPLRARGRVLGALTLGVVEGRSFGENDRRLLSIFAGHAALALENSRLYDDLRVTLDKLNVSQRRLVENERLQAAEELAAGVAHHINNRLMVILAGIQLLLPKVSEAARGSLEIVERTTLDTARLVDRLRKFTQGRPTAVAASADLDLAAQRAIDMCRVHQAEAEARGARVEVLLKLAGVPRVAADEALLEEALVNVIANAIEAVSGRGTVTIRTWAHGSDVLCAVTDTGAGMPEDVRQRAAEPFFTTKGPQRSGLGLSAAVGLMRQMGGDLDVWSEPGTGTRVTVRLTRFAS